MSSEIVPFLDGADSPSADSAAILGRPLGTMDEGVRPFDLLGLRSVERPTVNLIGHFQDTAHFLSSEKGPKCATQLNPTPQFLKSLLKKIKKPLLLHLRGCNQLFSPAASPFPFEKFKTLTSLEISGVSNFTTIPENTISEMTQLQSLNLSHLPIQKLPDAFFSNLIELRSLILKYCPYIWGVSFPSPMTALKYLELSHIHIWDLDFSYGFKYLTELERLILRGCSNLRSIPSIQPLKNLRELDLSLCTSLEEMELKKLPRDFWKLDLSYTALRFTSTLGDIRWITHLFLRDAEVIIFQGIRPLFNLKVLDVSGAQHVKGLHHLEHNKELEALDLSRTGVKSIDFISGLVKLRYLILKDCTRLQKLPVMEMLTQLEVLDISGCEILGDLPGDISSLETLKELNLPDGSLPKPNEVYIVSTFYGNSGFDRFIKNFDLIVELVSSFQENLKPVSCILPPPRSTDRIHADNSATTDPTSCHISSEIIKRDCKKMVVDLKYIRENIGLLESCPSSTRAEELLDQLTDARDLHQYSFYEIDPSIFHFRLNLTNFNEVLRTVVKLKLLVPPKQVEKTKRKVKINTRHIFGLPKGDCEVDMSTPEMQDLSSSYDSLTDIQKNCLLHFMSLIKFVDIWIKEKFLIQMWYGEGLIDPHHEGNVALSLCVEEIGREILMVLEENRFVERIDPWDRESKKWRVQSSAQSLVMARAKLENIFIVDHKTGKFTSHFTGSHLACLLELGSFVGGHINSSEKLESFKTVSTLINVNEPMVDIRAEWFSKMTNLCVLHLGGLYFREDQATEVVDLNFLEELKNMRQLRLLSLEGFLTIKKLPDSVCKVTNLRTLNLRDCGYLEELPAGIGSLNNLTHLDLTDCRILSMLPKGIMLLSKLEVLKGFVITYQIGGRQHRNACTLGDLLMLEKLRKLNLVVHTKEFPDSSDVHVFNGMKNLSSLKIIWQHNYNNLDQVQDQDLFGQLISLMKYSSTRQQLNLGEKQERQNETEKILRSNILKKLELRCFPFKTIPEWLHPSGLQKLEKLYVRGGKLCTLTEYTGQTKWNVETLVLKYLPNMNMWWGNFKQKFPYLTYLEVIECVHLSTYPCNSRGVWTLNKVLGRVDSLEIYGFSKIVKECVDETKTEFVGFGSR